jgi:hypothetical protein
VPDESGLSPLAPLGEPEKSGFGRSGPLADPGSGGCGGKPAAIRGRVPDALGRSRLLGGRAGADSLGRTGGRLGFLGSGCPAETRGPIAGGPDRSTIVGPGSEEADGARGRAGSRPLFPGGAFPELTAYVPTLTPAIAATIESIGLAPAKPPERERLFRQAPISCRFPIEFPSGIEASNQPKTRCD